MAAWIGAPSSATWVRKPERSRWGKAHPSDSPANASRCLAIYAIASGESRRFKTRSA